MSVPHDLKVGRLRVWILGRQFPESLDNEDGNWLTVKALYASPYARVSAKGAFIHLSEIARFLVECDRLNETLSGEACLKCVEPNLFIRIIPKGSLGRLALEVELSADHLSEGHRFFEEFDQSFLLEIIRSLRLIQRTHPVRGAG